MQNLSKDQKSALDALLGWYKSGAKGQYITMGGYAGTGKTTVISHLSKKLHAENKKLKIAFCAYTGKATRVLRDKLIDQESLTYKDNISTIHSLIYSPIENKKGIITGWELKEEVKYDLIIIDEASMVDSKIWNDLLTFNKPIIAVGDHGQLPPIEGFFNLMQEPDYTLEKIHRQAKGNPIIKVSIFAREEGTIPFESFSDSVVKISKYNRDQMYKIEDLLEKVNDDTLVLCGFNHTRVRLNNYIRTKLGFESAEPVKGDKIICLRNNHEKDIFNGMVGTIDSIKESEKKDWYSARFSMEGNLNYKGLVYKPQFNNVLSMNFSKERKKTLDGDLFDFGYVLTVHKAQGSQAKRVILFEERASAMDAIDWRKWLYTAVTRAEEELFIVAK